MGGPLGNTNSVRHGARTQRSGVVLAKLGKRFAPAQVDAYLLRRAVESQVRQQHGELTLLATARINTLCRLEQSCRACELMIRDTPGMTPDEVRQHRSMIVQWSCQRDRLLQSLLGNADTVAADPWLGLLDVPPAAEIAPRRAPEQQDDKSIDQGLDNAADNATAIAGGDSGPPPAVEVSFGGGGE